MAFNMKGKKILSNILFCILICTMLVGSFLIYANYKEGQYPFDEQIVMAKHDSIDAKTIGIIEPNDQGEITIDQLLNIQDNTLLGEIEYQGNSVRVIYNCNDASLIEASTLVDKGNYVGEIGCAKIYGYGANMSQIMNVGVDEIVHITMPYGNYEYKCVEKSVAKNDWDAARKNIEVSRGLILYCDDADDYGISGEYDIALFEMVSGPKVVG